MKSSATVRLVISGIIAFISYASWAYYANSLVTSESSILYKAALVQGSYSASITLLFTFMLEYFYRQFGTNKYCLTLITPRISTQNTRNNQCATLANIKAATRKQGLSCDGLYVKGVFLSPLPALIIQSILVVAVNVFFDTPNLWLTIAPSVLFSALYGYAYSIGLSRKESV